MKKLAICLYGFLRNYEDCYKSLMNKIVKPHNADVYIFTPNQRSADDFDDIISTSNLKKAYDTNYIKRWNYNRVNFIRDVSFLPKYNIFYQRPFRTLSTIYHFSKAPQMIKKSYKWIYLTRPDLPVSFFDISEADKNKINFRINNNPKSPIDDKYILGNQKNMIIFENFYKDVRQKYIKTNQVKPEMTRLLKYHLKQYNKTANFCQFTQDISSHKCGILCGHYLINNNLEDKCKSDNKWFYFRKDKIYE